MNRLLLIATLLSLPRLPVSTAGDNAPAPSQWTYSPERLRPIWQSTTVHGESVLFVRDRNTGEVKASLLFPVQKILAVHSSSGDISFEEGRDFLWKPDSREIVLPPDSRIPSFESDDFRRPAGSQPYRPTHRDGKGEILLGAGLEYQTRQTCITYTHAHETWPNAPAFDEQALPRTLDKLRKRQPVSMVMIGDSISAGGNASGWAQSTPFQPAYPELLQQHLAATYQTDVKLGNLSVGGMATDWLLTMTDKVAAVNPDLVIIAFGMNDSAGRSAAEYKANTKTAITKIREQHPDTEFILVASMLGNPDWTALKHELFPQYREALAELCEPGIALADATSIWTEMLQRKQDRDLTGNGLNHPNDFGHRVYTQVLSALLVPKFTSGKPSTLSLWNGHAPLGDGTFENADTTITVHRAAKPNGTAIVICPGGGYGSLVTGGEGHGIARWLNQNGITGIVLEYRLPNGRPFVPLLDAQRAIRIVRTNAARWNINPSEIGIIGFSAGGHLAATAATHFDTGDASATDPVNQQSCRPDFSILVYPVITMDETTHPECRKRLFGTDPSSELVKLFSNELHVTNDTSPSFLAHAMNDESVACDNSRMFYDALQANNVPSKYVELPSGGHGLNGYKGPMWNTWQQQSLEWLRQLPSQ